MKKSLKVCLDFSGVLVDDYESTKYCLKKSFGKLSTYFYNGFAKNKSEYFLYIIFNKFFKFKFLNFLNKYLLLRKDNLLKYINCMKNQNIKIYNSILEKILNLKEKLNIEYFIISLQPKKVIYKVLSDFLECITNKVYGLEEILKSYDIDLMNSKINLLRKIGCDVYVTDDPNEKDKIEKNYKNIKVFLIKSKYFKHKNIEYNKIEDIEEYIAKIFGNKFNF